MAEVKHPLRNNISRFVVQSFASHVRVEATLSKRIKNKLKLTQSEAADTYVLSCFDKKITVQHIPETVAPLLQA